VTRTKPKWMSQVRGTGMHRRTRATAYLDPDNVTTALVRINRGDPAPVLNVPECRAVVAHYTERGWSAASIARSLGLAERSIQRHRTALRGGTQSTTKEGTA
jgi:DNA-binding NarL/FixJ family response regulator